MVNKSLYVKKREIYTHTFRSEHLKRREPYGELDAGRNTLEWIKCVCEGVDDIKVTPDTVQW
jgi:hypothetical protein